MVTVAAGPFFNPANQSRYYRITGGDCNQFRAFAVAMGGDLASIDDAAVAFFLLLWLLNAVTEQQLNGVADYFTPIAASTRKAASSARRPAAASASTAARSA